MQTSDPQMPPSSLLPLAGMPIRNLTTTALIQQLYSRRLAGLQTQLLFANTNFIVKNQALRARLTQPSVWLVNDGIGVDLAAQWVHGRRFSDNLNGTDFTPALFKAGPPQRVYLLGSTAEDLQKAANVLTAQWGQQVVGMTDGFAGLQDPTLLDKINAAGAEVVLVGMGNPLQEQWILDHAPRLKAWLCMGVGALFVFMAGHKARAPYWVRRCRLEWLYRLMQEPGRLFKRYTIEMVVFFRLCLAQRQGGSQ